MSSWEHPGCGKKKSYTYLVTVPGGDSLLCKPYRKEQFYQLGYSSSTSSSSSSLQAVYCKETINTLSAIVYEESDSCTCQIPACFTCPRHDRLPQIFSAISCTECHTCSCVCGQSNKPKLKQDICRLAELVDVSSSVSDLLTKLEQCKCQTEERIVKKCKNKQKQKCECRPMKNICLKTVLKKKSCDEGSVKEINSSVSSHSNEAAVICLPDKRKLKFEACNEETNVCPGNVKKDVNINLVVNVKKEKDDKPVRRHKKCKCKDKKKKESKSKICKCGISPPVVICDRKPERNRTFFQAIKAMIPNASKNDKENTTRCECKKKTGKNENYFVAICTNEKGSHEHQRKLSSTTVNPSKPHGNEKSDQSKPRYNCKGICKHIEKLTKTGDNTNKTKNDSFHSKDRQQVKSNAKPETDTKPLNNQQTRPEMETKTSHRSKRRSSELNTIFLNNSGSSTDRSVFMPSEEKTVHYMFLETFERFPFRIAYNGLQKVTYNVKLSYKSILWLDLTDLNGALKFKKPSTRTVHTEWKALDKPSSLIEMNTNDKFSQVTGIVEQYQDNDKNLLSIVKKFEEYKNQQRALEDVKRKMSNSYHKGSTDSIIMRQVIRGKRRVFFTKVKCDYLCRIFCDYIGPLIYFFYLVVFFWVTF